MNIITLYCRFCWSTCWEQYFPTKYSWQVSSEI